MDDAKQIAETIIWFAGERFNRGDGQNLNSAIHGLLLEIKQYLMIVMAENCRKEWLNAKSGQGEDSQKANAPSAQGNDSKGIQ